MGGRGIQSVTESEAVKILEMTVISAKGLTTTKRLGRLVSVYVRISLDGKQKQRTKLARSSCPEPEWNEKLMFNLDAETLIQPLDPSRRLSMPDEADATGFLIEVYQGRPLSRKLLGVRLLSVMEAIEFSRSGFTYHTLCLRGACGFSQSYVNLGLRLLDPEAHAREMEVHAGGGALDGGQHVRRSSSQMSVMNAPAADEVAKDGMVMAAEVQIERKKSAREAKVAAIKKRGVNTKEQSVSVKPNPGGITTTTTTPPSSPESCATPTFGSISRGNFNAAAAAVAVDVAEPKETKQPSSAVRQKSSNRVVDGGNAGGGGGLARVSSVGNSRKRAEGVQTRPQFRSGTSRVSAEPLGFHRGAIDNMPPVRLIKRPGLDFTKGPPLPKLVVPYRDRSANNQSPQKSNMVEAGSATAAQQQIIERCSSDNENARENSSSPMSNGRMEEPTRLSRTQKESPARPHKESPARPRNQSPARPHKESPSRTHKESSLEPIMEDGGPRRTAAEESSSPVHQQQQQNGILIDRTPSGGSRNRSPKAAAKTSHEQCSFRDECSSAHSPGAVERQGPLEAEATNFAIEIERLREGRISIEEMLKAAANSAENSPRSASGHSAATDSVNASVAIASR